MSNPTISVIISYRPNGTVQAILELGGQPSVEWLGEIEQGRYYLGEPLIDDEVAHDAKLFYIVENAQEVISREIAARLVSRGGTPT